MDPRQAVGVEAARGLAKVGRGEHAVGDLVR